MNISNCEFNAVKWDESTVKVMQAIADGVIANANTLSGLVSVLKASNVHVETMIKVDNCSTGAAFRETHEAKEAKARRPRR